MTSPCTLASAARVLVTVVDTRGWQAIARARRAAGWLRVDWAVIKEWEGRGMMSCTCVKLGPASPALISQAYHVLHPGQHMHGPEAVSSSEPARVGGQHLQFARLEVLDACDHK